MWPKSKLPLLLESPGHCCTFHFFCWRFDTSTSPLHLLPAHWLDQFQHAISGPRNRKGTGPHKVQQTSNSWLTVVVAFNFNLRPLPASQNSRTPTKCPMLQCSLRSHSKSPPHLLTADRRVSPFQMHFHYRAYSLISSVLLHFFDSKRVRQAYHISYPWELSLLSCEHDGAANPP